MWTSLKNFYNPESLKTALELQSSGVGTYFSGGTYLVSEQDSRIRGLINVKGLLGQTLMKTDAGLTVGAAVSLQELTEALNGGPYSSIAEAARFSESSKNIRNQRTLGGEIARMRMNSELSVLLYALDARLNVETESGSERSTVCLWDGVGIITSVEIDLDPAGNSALERFALLPSAPAFVIFSAVKSKDRIIVVSGGRCSEYHLASCPAGDMSPDWMDGFAGAAVVHYPVDAYGSQAYKKILLKTALERIAGKL